MSSLIVGTIINSIIGIVGIVLGIAIIRFKMVNWIAGYNPQVHDEDKIIRIVGSNIILFGIIWIFYGVVFYFAYDILKDSWIYTTLNIITVVLIIIKIWWGVRKNAQKDS